MVTRASDRSPGGGIVCPSWRELRAPLSLAVARRYQLRARRYVAGRGEWRAESGWAWKNALGATAQPAGRGANRGGVKRRTWSRLGKIALSRPRNCPFVQPAEKKPGHR